ncbi:hypothetical protein MNBD_IGNAVI01-180 [hydrothermal vent metagenome]|uniref:Uncharacterized protein n=1 Tax=hydrothermal vent metagenome TaxID=652676 RepID=A0A3B1BV30_9ZZZZ
MENKTSGNILDTNNLSKLSKVLNYQLSTTLLFLLWYGGGLTLLAVTIAAILFSPYMLYVLYLEKKNGWITFFTILVLLPIIAIILSPMIELLFIPLALVYFYYFLLKFVVRDWIQEKNAKYELQKQILESKKKHEAEGDLDFLIQK